MKTRLAYKGRLFTADQCHPRDTVDELTGKNKEMRL